MRILEFVRKEFRQLRRDRRMLPFLFVVPVFQLVLFGYAVSTDVKHLKVIVCDLDHTAQSRDIVSHMANSEYFDLIGEIPELRQAGKDLDDGAAQIVLVIPRGFARDILAGDAAKIQALLDGSDANTGTVASSYLAQFFQAYAVRLLTVKLERMGAATLANAGVQSQIRVWYNPDLDSALFMVPGVMCIVVAIIATSLTAATIVKEREIGTIEQLIVTPIRSWDIILGKLLPYLVVGYVNIAVILVIATLGFHVPLRGSLGLLLALSGIFLVASLAIGLLISTVSHTQQQAMFSAVFFTMPNMLLSGFMFPIDNMPDMLQKCTYVLPMRYFLIIVRDIFLKGSGIALLWDQVIPMTFITAVILLTAVSRFHKRL